MKACRNCKKELMTELNYIRWLNELITQEYKGKIRNFIKKLKEMEGEKSEKL